jgi:DNA-binding beta-propeller fold protein YncE
VWPSAPERARIAYVGEVSIAAEPSKSRGFFGKILDFILGDQPAPRLALIKPSAIAVDSAGILYVTDVGIPEVFRIDPIAESFLPFSGGLPGGFQAPVGIAVRGDTVWVADAEARTVDVFRTNGDYLATVQGPFVRPTAVAADSATAYVVDAGAAAIVALGRDGSRRTLVDGRRDTSLRLNTPTNLTVGDSVGLAVVDALNFRVVRFTADGHVAGTFGRQGDAAGLFARPRGIARDRDGHLYVVDALHDAVMIFSPAGDFLLSFGDHGVEGPGRFQLPAGIAIGRDDRIYVADSYNHRIQIFRYLR